MKIPNRLLVISALGLAFAGCTGSQGPAGDGGPAGTNALTKTSTEPPGSNCPSGGIKVQAGLDTNNDGVLDDNEVNAASTTYVCNGSGKNSLVATSAEPVGANCPFGGTKIQTGLDANDNGTLDPSEVNAAATSYVCNVGPSGGISSSTGIVAAIKAVSTSATAPITVRFTLKDDRGYPLDVAGVYSENTPILPRFALAYFTKDATSGLVSPLTVYTKSASTAFPAGQPTNYNPLGTAPGFGTFAENGYGAGDYTYTFPTTSTTNGPFAVAYDATKLGETHVVWIQVSRQTDLVFPDNANTFDSSNPSYNFIPSGVGTPLTREIVAQAKCDACHAKFKAETTASAAFHGGGRVNAGMCNVCHNPARVSNPAANSSQFVHRIHKGELVATANQFHGIAATYPRDIRDCSACHGGAAQGAQSFSNPSTLACTGCHDYVSFTGSAAAVCQIQSSPGVSNLVLIHTTPPGVDEGKPAPCNHVAGPQPDTACLTCHGPTAPLPAANFHKPVVAPDPGNAWLVPNGNANTNASFVAAGGFAPTGAQVITYDVKSVDAVLDTTVTPNVKRPQITFKLKNNGTDVVFQTPPTATELMPNFVGSPSVYFVWSVPQDNIAKPSDFNASASGYVRNIWNGTATGTGAGSIIGPDASGYYKITLTGVQVSAAASMLTGGVGYTYSLSSAPPLVQTNVAEYPWTPDQPLNGHAQGGLSIPSPDVWKVGTGFTGRRNIVDNAKCNACHGTLGVAPTFHAGARNDGPTCSFCHNPTRTSSGWSAGSKYFIHAIHAGRKRVVNFTWHATQAGPGYDEVEFPGTLNSCTTCHVPNTFDFTNAANLAAVSNMELYTVATGKYDGSSVTNPANYYTLSPYVVQDNVTDYGPNFAYNAATNVTTPASGNNLVLSPITTACSACHDSTSAINHMKLNGGLFYATRASVLPAGSTAPPAQTEQCLICHGPGRVAAIGEVHQH